MANQIKKKFILDGAVDGLKMKLLTGQALIQEGGMGDVEVIKIDGEGKVQLSTGEAAVKADVSAEESARISGDNALGVRIDGVESDLSSEESARIAGDASLQSQINDILSNSDPAALDSLSEIVAAFQAADSDLSDAITAALGTHTSELAVETQARIDGDNALQTSLNSEISAREAGDLMVQANLDQEITDRGTAVSGVQSNLDSEVSTRMSEDTAIRSEFAAADLVLKGTFDGSETNVSIKELDDAMKAEISARSGADTTLQSNIDSEESARVAADNVLQGNIDSEASSRASADTTLQSNIDVEKGRITQEISDRTSADASLQTQINNILSNTDPAALDSLTEVVSAFEAADSNLNNAIMALATEIKGDLSDAVYSTIEGLDDALAQEISDRMSGDSALDSRLSTVETQVGVLENTDFFFFTKSLTAMDISNGYIDLQHEIVENSSSSFVDRLAIFEGVAEDYSVSTVNGVSRITFLNELVSGGSQELSEGDKISIKYSYIF